MTMLLFFIPFCILKLPNCWGWGDPYRIPFIIPLSVNLLVTKSLSFCLSENIFTFILKAWFWSAAIIPLSPASTVNVKKSSVSFAVSLTVFCPFLHRCFIIFSSFSVTCDLVWHSGFCFNSDLFIEYPKTCVLIFFISFGKFCHSVFRFLIRPLLSFSLGVLFHLC